MIETQEVKYRRGRYGLFACDDVGVRFFRFVVKTDTCWNWSGFKAHGYGVFSLHQVNFFAHRFSWEWHVGPIPFGSCVLHHCDNPACVRPAHLFIGSKADNNRDRTAKGRNRPKSTYQRVTHCGKGHEFTPENTWTGLKGQRTIRQCRACHRLRDAAKRRPTNV